MTRLQSVILAYLAAVNRPVTMYELFRLGRVEAVNKAVGKMLETGELETVEAEHVVCVRAKRVETSTDAVFEWLNELQVREFPK